MSIGQPCSSTSGIGWITWYWPPTRTIKLLHILWIQRTATMEFESRGGVHCGRWENFWKIDLNTTNWDYVVLLYGNHMYKLVDRTRKWSEGGLYHAFQVSQTICLFQSNKLFHYVWHQPATAACQNSKFRLTRGKSVTIKTETIIKHEQVKNGKMHIALQPGFLNNPDVGIKISLNSKLHQNLPEWGIRFSCDI